MCDVNVKDKKVPSEELRDRLGIGVLYCSKTGDGMAMCFEKKTFIG